MDNNEKLWITLKTEIEKELSKKDFDELIKSLEYKTTSADNVVLVAPDALTTYRIKKFVLNRMNEILKEISEEPLRVEIVTKDEIDTKKKDLFMEPDDIDSYTKRNIRPENTFENFVIGENNRYAFLTAIKAAESPFEVANPLYIFGDVGLGKTHLMMAIGNYILDKNAKANVIYVPAQQFAEDYYHATHNIKNFNIDNFYSYYKSADVLLVDDIQLLSGKNATQEEFFKLFELLNENNKQIIITSDKPANELENMMARLKSRFSWGVAVDIKRPDFEHRKMIVLKKLALFIQDPTSVPSDIVEYIALNFDENVRELEGAIRRMINYCKMLNVPINIENAEKSLSSIISKNKKGSDVSVTSKAEKIKYVVSTFYQIDPKELIGSSKKKEVVWPRQIAMYLLRTQLSLSLSEIGKMFGGRDHTTVVHAEEKVRNAIKNGDWTVQNQLDILCSKLEQN